MDTKNLFFVADNYWSLNAISSCLWYTRKTLKDKDNDKIIWTPEFDFYADGTDMTADAKFGFNVLTCFAYSAAESKEEIYTLTIRHIDEATGQELADQTIVPIVEGMKYEEVMELMDINTPQAIEKQGYKLKRIVKDGTEDLTEWWKNIVGWVESLV